MGAQDAKVALMEFADFECPYCSQFVKTTLPEIKTKYVDTGKVIFVFRHNPLSQIHSRAEAAAQASECAVRQGRFWQLHDHLFRDPRRLEESDLIAYAGAADLDVTAFRACIAGSLAERVKNDADLARTLRLTGTPVFLVGRVIPGGLVKVSQVLTGVQTTTEFATAIDQALRTAGASD